MLLQSLYFHNHIYISIKYYHLLICPLYTIQQAFQIFYLLNH
nr:MAG TPA: hypothetical protein [Caudoviricetes sp.]